MTSFIIKQMVGNKLDSVKEAGSGAVGGDGKEGEGGAEGAAGEDPELVEQRRLEEEARLEKHRKLEEEREKMRAGIREKFKIQKKEEIDFSNPNSLGRSKKPGMPGDAPPPSAFSGPMPTNINEATDRLKAIGGELGGKVSGLTTQAADKCCLQ